jgi:hypothetical protein
VEDKFSRRDVLQGGAVFGVVAIVGIVGGAGCGKEKKRLSCIDTSGLAPGDAQFRSSPAVAYLDMAADPAKTCDRCQQFIPPPTANACGTCKVVKGSVHPKGGCKLFVAKVA